MCLLGSTLFFPYRIWKNKVFPSWAPWDGHSQEGLGHSLLWATTQAFCHFSGH